jgi:hypothetical protein
MNVEAKTAAAPRMPTQVEDSGRVRIGAISPSFAPVRAAPASTKDDAKVRLGAISPSFSPVRNR